MNSMVENNFPKSGFLSGAAARRMKNFFQRKHDGYLRSNEDTLRELGLGLTPEATEGRVLSNPLNVDGVQDAFKWDTFTLAANTPFPTPITMFGTTQSQATKGLAQTNMQNSQALSAQESFTADGLRFYILNNAIVADVLALYTNTSISIIQGPNNYPVWQGVPWMLPAGGGVHISGGNQVGTAPVNSSVLFSLSNGEPTITSCYKLTIPIILSPLEIIFAQLITQGAGFSTAANTTNPPGTGLTFVLAFEGVLTRQMSIG
jgi:hypothetical protein